MHEAARDVARAVAQTPAYQQSRRDRKKVEMLFGHLKRILKLDRLRLRGMSGAHDEFILAATAQNLRRMALWMNRGPPDLGVSVPPLSLHHVLLHAHCGLPAKATLLSEHGAT